MSADRRRFHETVCNVRVVFTFAIVLAMAALLGEASSQDRDDGNTSAAPIVVEPLQKQDWLDPNLPPQPTEQNLQ